jgi:hypothetical protein
MLVRPARADEAGEIARQYARMAEEGWIAGHGGLNTTHASRAATRSSSRCGPTTRALSATAGLEVEGLKRDHYRRKDGSLRSALLMARLL